MIAEAVAGVALELGAEAVVHGCTGKGNDQVRFELAFKASYPGVKVIARSATASGRGRGDRLRRVARDPGRGEAGVAVLDRRQPPRPRDRGRDPRGPVGAPPGGRVRPDRSPATAPPPTEIVIGFEAGLPVSLDGEELPLAELIAR